MSDTLTVKQRDWLAGLIKPSVGGKAPVAAKSEVAAARLKAREQVLATALAEIDKVKDRLAEASKSVEVMNAKGQKLKLLTGELDPDAEVDTHADVHADSDVENAKLLPEIARLMAVIVTQQERLRDAATKPDGTLAEDGRGDKLFGEADIATEIWTPLVRAGVLPENLVQKRYSEVAKTFAGAQANYAKRLEAFSEAEETKNGLAETLGVGAEVLETAGRAANLAAEGILELRGADKALKDNVKAGITLIAAAGVMGANVGQAALSAADGAKLAKAMADTVKAAFGVSGMADTTQKIAGKVVDVLLHGNKLRASVIKGQVGPAIDSLGEALEGGLAAVGEYIGDKELIRTLAAIGGTVKGSIKTSAAAKKVYDAPAGDTDALLEAFTDLAKEAAELAAHAVKSKIENDDWLARETQTKEIADALKQKVVAAQTQVEAIMKACLKEETDLPEEIDSIVELSKAQLALEASTKLTEKWQELLKSAAKGQDPRPISRDIGVLISDLIQKADALDALRNDVAEQVKTAGERTAEINTEEEDEEDDEEEDEDEEPSEAVQAIMAKLKAATDGIEPETAILIEVESKARLEAMQQDREEFAAKLANDFTAVVDETDDAIQQARLAVNKLEPLVAQIKRDRAWLKLADTLASAGAKLGAAMFEGLNPVESFKTCAVNIYTGIQHLQEVKTWQANVADSRNAGASALLAAEFNRAGLEQTYLTTEWINGTIKAIEGIGTTLKVTGITAPGGKLTETGAKAAGETAKLVTKYFAASRLKSAWSDYQQAMLDPDNRKKVRAALRSNATLAKYALAWAATEARDPLAREAMRKCGLSDAVLADEDTNAQAVVEYLETLYDKDPVVLKASPVPSRWWPGKPELSARSWIKFLAAAEKTETGLRGASGVLVTQLLVRMEKLMPAATTQPVDDTAVAAARAALDELIEVLTDYDPLDEAGEPQAEMRQYADVLLAQAELKRRTLPDRQ